MAKPFVGTIRFINQRRTTGIVEVALEARVIRQPEYVFIDAGPLGSVMCHRTLIATFEGVPYQRHRRLPVRIVIRSVHDLDARVRLFFEGYPTAADDPCELPQVPFIHGNVDARSDS